MNVRNNELYVIRGESFNMQKIIQNRDGSPYIVSKQMSHPYFLITVSNSKYGQNNRYVYNKWIAPLFTFNVTQPVNIKDLGYTTFADLPAGYEGDALLYANEAVFTDGKNYKYWKYNNRFNDVNDYSGEWLDYVCEFSTTFSSDVTSEWIEQTYFYNILLVSGENTTYNLIAIWNGQNLGPTTDKLNMYQTLLELDPNLVSHIKDVNRPITNIGTIYDILPATKIFVQTNMKGVDL